MTREDKTKIDITKMVLENIDKQMKHIIKRQSKKLSNILNEKL